VQTLPSVVYRVVRYGYEKRKKRHSQTFLFVSMGTHYNICRHPARVGGDPEQLQPLPHQDHRVGRDHHGPLRQVHVRLQLHGA